MTHGELGGRESPEAVKRTRKKEMEKAAKRMKMLVELKEYPDLGLSMIDKQELAAAVIKELRQEAYGVVFSFHPGVLMEGIDHPDHTAAGDAARMAACAVNVANFIPQIPAVDNRPELYLLTGCHVGSVSIEVSLGKREREEGWNYLREVYKSQFAAPESRQWQDFFENYREIYQKIR